MSKYRRKFLSILLTFALIMTLIPAQVFAQNTMGIPIVTTEENAISNPYIGDGFEAEFKVLN